jgi:hypothetical protein
VSFFAVNDSHGRTGKPGGPERLKGGGCEAATAPPIAHDVQG